jgi:hypothetical protein
MPMPNTAMIMDKPMPNSTIDLLNEELGGMFPKGICEIVETTSSDSPI